MTFPERFVFQWGSTPSTTVELSFYDHSEGTLVIVKETGFPHTKEGRQRYLDNATGWGEALTLMKFYSEHGLRY